MDRAARNTAEPDRAESTPPFPIGNGAALSAPVDSDIDATASNTVTTPAAEPVATDNNGWLPWLIGGGLCLFVIAGWLLRRRRLRHSADPIAENDMVDAPGTPDASMPVAAPSPLPAPTPARRVEEDRPHLTIHFTPTAARVTLVGAAVGYTLRIENSGSRAAEDVFLSGMLTNADAQQQGVLAHFFTTAETVAGDPIGRIEAGQAIALDGEMRIGHDRIVPIEMQGRKLLIPVVALNVRYEWVRDQRIDRGAGRTGAAFIVGQESDPPREKMAPFRLDQGSRQYRAVGARSAQPAVTD